MGRPRWETDGKDWPNRAASRFVSAGGVKWHVQVMGPPLGTAPVALLLHGTGAATHSWRDLAPLLAARMTVIAPDLPGHGFSAPLRPASLDHMARALAGLNAALGAAPDLIIGHSAGAAIGLGMVAHGVAEPKALVSIGGALLPFPGMASKLFPAVAKWMALNPFTPELFAWRARSGETASFLARATGSRIDAGGVALYGRLFATSGHCAGALAMMGEWDLEPLAAALPRIATPVLLIHGDRDATIPASTSRTAAARLPAGRLDILPGLGHLTHEEAPANIAERIVDFAAELGILSAFSGETL
jgi:magnesium chelatase accessory protein